MTEEDFLKRWSRRKREVAEAEKPAPPKADAHDRAPLAEHAVPGDSTKTAEAEFDPATLPPIESITALSDITVFLRAGVPAELTRAALRRVWTADPSIRDFVGLAENAWDFTDPNAMPGFGPLESTEEVRQMIARLVDSIGKAAQPDAGDVAPERAVVSKTLNDSSVIDVSDPGREGATRGTSGSDQNGEAGAEILRNPVLLQSNKEDAATQYGTPEADEKPKQLSRRGHGGALPR